MLFCEHVLRSLVYFILQLFEILFISFFLYMLNKIWEIGFLCKNALHVFYFLFHDTNIYLDLFGHIRTFLDTFFNKFQLEFKSFTNNFENRLFYSMNQFIKSFL